MGDGLEPHASMPLVRCVALCILVLGGCGSAPHTVEEVAQLQHVSVDSYMKTRNEIGAAWQPSYGIQFRLRRWSSLKDNSELYFLDCFYKGLEWLFLEHAFDSDGARLAVSVDDHDVTRGGWVHELVRVTISREYLDRRVRTGLDIKLVGKRGSLVVRLPAMYVEGFLLALSRAG